MIKTGEKTRRMREQKWMFDKIIEAVGVDFFWPMTRAAMGAAGLDVAADVESIRARVRKYVDIPREFARVAAKREGMGKKAESEGHLITARDNFFSASIFYILAQGLFHDDGNEENLAYNSKKVECYDKYIKNASHPVERVQIPFEGTTLPGFLHLPNKHAKKFPCVVAVGGMDVFKELLTLVYGDKLLERGMAVLSFDGPGQNEARVARGLKCTPDNFAEAGRAVMDFVQKRPEIDGNKVAISGVSMGSFWAPQIAAYDHRYKAVVGMFVCHEPGFYTAFNEACPIFKARFMWMAGYDDEEKFDKFVQSFTLKGVASKIKCPVLIVAGEDDEVSPIANSYAVYEEITAPKKIVVWEGEKHGLSHYFDAKAMVADWLKDRLDGKPMVSERVFISKTGEEIRK